eukprot:scaffold189322_cov17-Prasinocladus_malaysianus.AAC.1
MDIIAVDIMFSQEITYSRHRQIMGLQQGTKLVLFCALPHHEVCPRRACKKYHDLQSSTKKHIARYNKCGLLQHYPGVIFHVHTNAGIPAEKMDLPVVIYAVCTDRSA